MGGCLGGCLDGLVDEFMSRAVRAMTDSTECRPVSRGHFAGGSGALWLRGSRRGVVWRGDRTTFRLAELPKLPAIADAIIELGGPGNRDGACGGRAHR